jgi:hypothetical protein
MAKDRAQHLDTQSHSPEVYMKTFRATSNTVACTLTQDDLTETVLAWKKLLRLSLVAREDIPGGLRLVVHPGSADALRQLIDVERECCRWITFQLNGPAVLITAAGGGESTIREIWGVDAGGHKLLGNVTQ